MDSDGHGDLGVGLHADVSMLEALCLCFTTYHDLFGQFVPGFAIPIAIETPSIEPCKDGWIGLCTYTGQQWKDLCALIGRPDVGDDERGGLRPGAAPRGRDRDAPVCLSK